jgi:hypothetical protein
MIKPRMKKDKLSDGWCVSWYGMTVWVFPPGFDIITGEHYPPRLSICKTNPDKPVMCLEIDLEE